MQLVDLVTVLTRVTASTKLSQPPDELRFDEPDWVNVDPDLRMEIEAVLSTFPSVIESLDAKEDFFPGGGGRITRVSSLATWLVWRSLHESPERAVADLCRYCDATTLPYHAVLGLTNVQMSESVALVEGVELVPFADIPDCLPKRLLHKDGGRESQYGPLQLLLPETALVYSEEIPKTELMPKNAGYDLLHDLALILGLIGPTPVANVAWLRYLEDWVPGSQLALGCHIESYPHIERPHRSRLLTLDECDTARRLWAGYSGLPKEGRARTRVALTRLNNSLRAPEVTDRLIDLTTALEVAGAWGAKPRPGRIKQHIIAHALDLVADEASKHTMQSTLDALYNLRSEAVHTGRVAEGLFEGKYPEQWLKDAVPIVGKAIQRRLENGS